MKSIRLLAAVTTLGFVVAVGCGDDSSSGSKDPGGDAGEGNGGGTPGAGGTKNTTAGTKNTTGGSDVTDAGAPPVTNGGGGMDGGAGVPNGPGCGDGPLCDEATQECVDGVCLLIDGETCATNADCVHTCIGLKCAPRADVLEACDYEGAGGAGGAGAGGSGGTGGTGVGGAFEPPEEMGNGDDLDCLDGLGCDSGTCKRKAMTDCTGPEQCLSGICHKSKCTPEYAGSCQANACGAPDMSSMCAPTTTATNDCSFNYIPNSACTLGIKGATCDPSCVCTLAP